MVQIVLDVLTDCICWTQKIKLRSLLGLPGHDRDLCRQRAGRHLPGQGGEQDPHQGGVLTLPCVQYGRGVWKVAYLIRAPTWCMPFDRCIFVLPFLATQ